MEMLIIKRDSPEWEYMWNWLANHPINQGIEEPTVATNPLNDEAWHYMGSYRNDGKVIHEFRHRSHPSNGDRITYNLKASSNMTDEDIEEELPVK